MNKIVAVLDIGEKWPSEKEIAQRVFRTIDGEKVPPTYVCLSATRNLEDLGRVFGMRVPEHYTRLPLPGHEGFMCTWGTINGGATETFLLFGEYNRRRLVQLLCVLAASGISFETQEDLHITLIWRK